ncbi:30S ribosomal protein S17e [Candidatus Woesearchaeota archaeon]|nr:30S ribosomal protein S17e [Candidatus Woesearchaeota archaeon]
MGRIKTKRTKRLTKTIMEKHPDKITKSFEKNKVNVQEVAEIRSKKLRNVMAGYAVRLKKQEEKLNS